MPESPGVTLLAPHYVLGEEAVDHTEIENLRASADAFGMVAEPSLWGWGTVHRTTGDAAALAVRSGTQTLRQAGVEPTDVDALVLCSVSFPDTVAGQSGMVQSIVRDLGLGDVAVLGITLNRCANLLAGLRVARALVAAGAHRRVLVVTADRVADESQRMTDFALFSDGAASCLVTEWAPGGFDLVADACAQDASALVAGQLSAELSKVVNQRIFEAAGISVAQIEGLSHGNLYLPIVTMKELQAGFAPSQVDTTNTARVGHCFAADPLINLVDRVRAGRVRRGGYHLLASSVPGLRVGVLLRATEGAP